MFKLLGALLLIAYPGLVYVGLTRFEPMYLTLIVIAATAHRYFREAERPALYK